MKEVEGFFIQFPKNIHSRPQAVLKLTFECSIHFHSGHILNYRKRKLYPECNIIIYYDIRSNCCWSLSNVNILYCQLSQVSFLNIEASNE